MQFSASTAGRGGSTAPSTAHARQKAVFEVPRGVVPLGAVVPLFGAVVPLRDADSCPRRDFDRFGRKNLPKNFKSEGKLMELGYGNAKEGRSTCLASDLWNKTCKNASKSQIDPKCEFKAIFVEFSNLGKLLKIGG